MERVIDFPVQSEHYHADACTVWCFDDRFSPALEKLVNATQCKHIDLIKVAGGAKGLASGDDAERAYLLDQIAKSIKLHEPNVIWLMVHADCGAYGNPKFDSPEAEAAFFAEELGKAESAVRIFFQKNNITTPIKKYSIDFKKIAEL